MPVSSEKSAYILQAEALVKSYKGQRVVDELSLRCQKGRVLGLLGPNGAGKTTTLRMLYGFVKPDGGTITIQGHDFQTFRSESKRLIGVCTQDDSLDQDFTVRENLFVYAGYFRPRVPGLQQRVDELLQRFGLNKYANHKPMQLSGGYKRRLMIARSVVHQPQILFLDEPTTGLDPRARVDVWELIDALRTEGLAIILTTHYMDEAERLSDDLLVLDRGRKLAFGSTKQVLGHLLGEHVLVIPAHVEEREAIRHWLIEHFNCQPAMVLGELRVPLTTEQLAQFTQQFAHTPCSLRPPNLDDLFLNLSASSTLD